ncbi:uncharacterized protein Dana_GF15093, isoform C [Drosophila ananassae]|uniref:Cilia- and flagella-associated protein 91 n=1 Tax=Drosophila ananassae TaxID=7217 RepID=A0A0P8XEZ4_DROAN|nr:uncharacterized protein LOC116654456 [Drosophila ananassae]KPU73120.1 uncharacterized protein Dana_GF15093, isoform C [Drosophila ananassae]
MPYTEKEKKKVLERERQERQERPLRVLFTTPEEKKELGHKLTSCLTTSVPHLRMTGGSNDPSKRRTGKLPRTDSECQLKAPGIKFLSGKYPKVTTHEVTIPPSITSTNKLREKCDFFPKFEDKNPLRNQITQTLYRESSAQTLAFLPEVLDKENVKPFELFSLPSVLPGDKPPGLYEAEVLERSRKRWTFRDALKANLGVLLKDAREKAIKSQYKPLLEAFEWEQWIEREEYIQECQMMRLEIVIKMFDKREKEMHSASKSRIEKACEEIEKRRQAALQKNEREYNRGMHRLEISLSKSSRKWQRQSPLHSLSNPCSEFYAPLMRHGVDPARRSYVPKTERKAFDMRIDDLEKQVNMSSLKCPFRSLKKWSKPKEHMREYEQNFCNEKTLQKLFDTLKTLRTQSTKDKEAPRCLRKRVKPYVHLEHSHSRLNTLDNLYETQKIDVHASFKEPHKPPSDWRLKPQLNSYCCNDPKYLVAENNQKAIEDILNSFEGTYIGWYMQFLSEEMARFTEQRRLHILAVLAQKERWRREAAEAGLRQRENDIRRLYEEMFQKTSTINQKVSNDYIKSILTTDMQNYAQGVAVENTTHLARQIDGDIERWLESFKLIQNPLTFVPLRMMLKDMVSPDLDEVLRHHESFMVVKYVVEDVLFPKMWNGLDNFDIAFTLTSDLIDRLIDNDLYLFSTDSESETPQKPSWYEAEAIIRKLIRQAVPGRRWMEPNERIVHEIYNSLVDNVFMEILNNMELALSTTELIELCSFLSHGDIGSSDDIRAKENEDMFSIGNVSSMPDTEFIRSNILNMIKKQKGDKITGELENLDHYITDDVSVGLDTLLGSQIYTPAVNTNQESNDIFSLKSTYNISDQNRLKILKGRGYRIMLPTMTEMIPDRAKRTLKENEKESLELQKQRDSLDSGKQRDSLHSGKLDSEKKKETLALGKQKDTFASLGKSQDSQQNQESAKENQEPLDSQMGKTEDSKIRDYKREQNINELGPDGQTVENKYVEEVKPSGSDEDHINKKRMPPESVKNRKEDGNNLIEEVITEVSTRRSYENIAFDIITQILGNEFRDDESELNENQNQDGFFTVNVEHISRQSDKDMLENKLMQHMDDPDIKEGNKSSNFSLAFNANHRFGPSESDVLIAPSIADMEKIHETEGKPSLTAGPSDQSTVVYGQKATTSQLKK